MEVDRAMNGFTSSNTHSWEDPGGLGGETGEVDGSLAGRALRGGRCGVLVGFWFGVSGRFDLGGWVWETGAPSLGGFTRCFSEQSLLKSQEIFRGSPF